jgi:hypothetical protein
MPGSARLITAVGSEPMRRSFRPLPVSCTGRLGPHDSTPNIATTATERDAGRQPDQCKHPGDHLYEGPRHLTHHSNSAAARRPSPPPHCGHAVSSARSPFAIASCALNPPLPSFRVPPKSPCPAVTASDRQSAMLAAVTTDFKVNLTLRGAHPAVIPSVKFSIGCARSSPYCTQPSHWSDASMQRRQPVSGGQQVMWVESAP